MQWEPWIVVITAFLIVGGALRGWSWWLRERVIRALSTESVRRMSRGISLRVLVRGTDVFPGMRSNRTHRTWEICFSWSSASS